MNLQTGQRYYVYWKVEMFANRSSLVQGGHKSRKPGILRDFSEYGKLTEFSGK